MFSGRNGEQVAALFLMKKGYDIEIMNYRSRFGEIDIIATNEEYLLFVEVKTRSKGAIARPAESVTKSKQQKIIATALRYLQFNETNLQPRFDVIEVYIKDKTEFKVEKVVHLENAFLVGDEGFAVF